MCCHCDNSLSSKVTARPTFQPAQSQQLLDMMPSEENNIVRLLFRGWRQVSFPLPSLVSSSPKKQCASHGPWSVSVVQGIGPCQRCAVVISFPASGAWSPATGQTAQCLSSPQTRLFTGAIGKRCCAQHLCASRHRRDTTTTATHSCICFCHCYK